MQFNEDLSQVQSESQQQRLVEDDSTNYDDDWLNFNNDDNFENDENCPPNDFQEESDYIRRKINEIDIGQNCRSWVEIMQNFHSKKAYMEKIQDFVDYISENISDMTLEQQLNAYFQIKLNEKNADGTDRYRATTLRSWLSVYGKFWKFVRYTDLKAIAPQLEANIATKEKQQQQAKQAKVFTKEELVRFYQMPRTPENLADMAYSVIGLSFGGRGAEIIKVTFEDVSRTVSQETGEMKILVKYLRTKQKGVPEQSQALITGALEVEVLNEYEKAFDMADKKGRYFMKLTASQNGFSIKGTKQVIGHNITAKTGMRIATRLGLPDANLYTGHTFRRTCATICAEAGMQLAAIKQVTGHKSDMVAQRYIDHSDHMKQGGADILSLGGLQRGQDGTVLRKRTYNDMSVHNTQNNSQSTSTATSSSSNTHKGTVVNITFNNCNNVTYSPTEYKS